MLQNKIYYDNVWQRVWGTHGKEFIYNGQKILYKYVNIMVVKLQVYG